MARTTLRPNKKELGQIAERRPEFLNVLVAYFVMEWDSITLTSLTVPPHGQDQKGTTRLVPNYIGMWGVDACVYYLLRSPERRAEGGPGYVTDWLEKVSEIP